mmetsp:Transcript_32963/g.60336  ORF Transcript_32963/g.60336 Transcript_32963/m.60336 type:complete len:653 (-) Transcript_32963:30-1988(-)
MASVANPLLEVGFGPKLGSALTESALEQRDAFTFEVSSSLRNEVMRVSAAEDGQFEELRALAWKVLDSKGVLAEVRAQLQACVFEAIDQNAANVQVTASQAQQRGPHTALSEELVAEFLTFRGLQHSLKVFSTEAQLQQPAGGQSRQRMEVAADLGLGSTVPSHETSLLEQLLESSAIAASADGSASAATTAMDVKVGEGSEKRLHKHKSKSTGKHNEKGSKRHTAESRPSTAEMVFEQPSRFDSLTARDLEGFPVKTPHGPGPSHSPRAGHDAEGLHMRGTYSHGVSSVHSKDEVSSRPSRPSSTATLLERGAERASNSFGIAGTAFGSRTGSESSVPHASRNRLPPLSTGESSASGSGHFLPGVRHQPRQPTSPKSSSSTAHVAFSVPSRGPSSPQLSPTSQSHSGHLQTFFHGANHSQSGSHMVNESPRINFRSERHQSGPVAAASVSESHQTENLDVTMPVPLVSPPASPKSVSSFRARVGVGLDFEHDGHHRAVSEGSSHGLSTLSTVHGPLPKLPAGTSAGMPNLDSLDLSGSDEASLTRSAQPPAQEQQEQVAVASPITPAMKDGSWHGQEDPWQESSELETSTRVPTPMHTGGCGMSSSQPTLGLSKSLSHDEVSGSPVVEESWQSDNIILNIQPVTSPEPQMP